MIHSYTVVNQHMIRFFVLVTTTVKAFDTYYLSINCVVLMSTIS